MTQRAAIEWCLVYFTNLDRSNAAMHLAEVRYSPITFRLAEILNEDANRSLEPIRRLVSEVMAHAGTYEEDRGR